MIQIRPAASADNEYLCTTLQNTFALHNSIDNFYAASMNEEDLKQFLQTQDLIFVATDNNTLVGGVIGNCILTPTDRSAPYANLRNIWVEEAARGNGVAQLLVTAFETAAKSAGAEYIDLHADTRNVSAQALWNSQNFIPYQERRKKLL